MGLSREERKTYNRYMKEVQDALMYDMRKQEADANRTRYTAKIDAATQPTPSPVETDIPTNLQKWGA